MNRAQILFLAIVHGSVLTSPLLAHGTNLPPLTRLEAFELQTDTTIIKGTGQLGALSAGTATVTVKCRESINLATSHREYGVLIGIREGQGTEDNSFIDSDELESFLAALEYIGRADYNLTDLPSFAVGFNTRDALRVSAFSSNKNPGTIQATLQTRREEHVRVLLSPEQLAQFRTYVQQAKAKLDELRAARNK